MRKGPLHRTVIQMKRHFRILAGTAIGLQMAFAPLPAFSRPSALVRAPASAPLRDAPSLAAPVIPAQAQTSDQEEVLRKLKRKGGESATPRARGAAEAPAPRKQLQRARPEARAPAKAEQRVLRRKAREGQSLETSAPAAAQERLKRRKEREAVIRRAEPRKAPVAAEEPRPKGKSRDVVKRRAAEPEAPAVVEERLKRRKEREAVTRRAEPRKAPVAAEEPRPKGKSRDVVKQRAAEPEAPAIVEERLKGRKERETVLRPPEAAARFFDSAKEKPAKRGPEREQAAQPSPPKAVRMPESDAAAQAEIRARPQQVRSVIFEEGRRIKRPRKARPEIPAGSELVREVNNRFVFQTGNNYFVERPREERIIVDAREVYYEELPRNRQREVVIRPDGTRIITIRNRWGDVIRRVKVLPDDREIVLVYVDDDYYDEVLEWRDPGIDLPPLNLTIPVGDYILDAEGVEDPEDYYTFLEQPPVERVERTYSLAEVRRSARIRDKVRRIDLDIINFEFGSAEIPESEIGKLEGVAEAMQRLLKDSPGETFLIEGHTDAVGSEVANLALSDQRAEAVATALTNVFDIPPENMETQGYGEQYLKVEIEEPERENRRVAIRRITPLVAPVASAE
jgi:outer membrane protein OmpA-like peptidoglycan-associated protein